MAHTIGLVDDHVLLRKGLVSLLQDLGYEITIEADNGEEFIRKLKTQSPPEVVLMDINMPQMNGYEATEWLKNNHPSVHVIALSMYDDENSIIRMLRSGARGYLLKDCEPAEMRRAIEAVLAKGFYNSEMVTGRVINSLNNHAGERESASGLDLLGLNNREIEFMRHLASDMSYKEIAEVMALSPRTIEGYRDNICQKLNIKTRVGLVLFAIRQGIIIV